MADILRRFALNSINYLMPNSLDIDPSPDWVFSSISLENLKGGSLAEIRTNLVNYCRFLEAEVTKLKEQENAG
jgi:hypothetical protein